MSLVILLVAFTTILFGLMRTMQEGWNNLKHPRFTDTWWAGVLLLLMAACLMWTIVALFEVGWT